MNREKMNRVTVLTPTYNRANELIRLYESLCRQSNKCFTWLIVDDGSVDDTKNIIDQLIAKNDLNIEYIYKENGGKHTALNLGISKINTELTFIVDSDDWLVDDAIDIILRYHKKYGDKKYICGYSFLRQYPDGKINGKGFSQDEIISTCIKMRINSKDASSDKAEVFKTECLLEFPFPEFAGEKFLGEDTVWIRMTSVYQMVYINKVIYVGDYLKSGLTHNRRKHNIYSPKGCMCRAEEFLRKEVCLKYRIKGALQYVIYGRFAGYNLYELIQRKCQFIVIICAIPGSCIYLIWKYKYAK